MNKRFSRIISIILIAAFALFGIHALSAGFFIYSDLVHTDWNGGIVESGTMIWHLTSWGISLGSAFLLILINRANINLGVSLTAFVIYLTMLFLYLFLFEAVRYLIFPAAFISFIALLISFICALKKQK